MTVYINYIDKTDMPTNYTTSYIRKFEDVRNYDYSAETNTLRLSHSSEEIIAVIKIEDGMYFTVHQEDY